jgi:6-pyruvoyltetrahydropterin/6-carboxytetrahydropterin synthase
MFRVTREIDFCYGHRLLNYDGKCKHLHGHNGRAVIVIESEKLDNRGMVLDFSDIKRVVSGWIEDNLDHRMILHRADPAREMLEKLGEPMYLVDENPRASQSWKPISGKHHAALPPIGRAASVAAENGAAGPSATWLSVGSVMLDE